METPFTTGKAYRDDELGEAAVRQANWRYAAFGAMGVSVLLILLEFCTLLMLRRIPIRVIEVSPESGAVHITQADFSQYVPPETVYVAQLRDDVITLRSISTDKETMRRWHVRARTRMTLQGKKQYEVYEKERKPFAQKEPVTVDILSILHDGGLTWDVRWRETKYSDRIEVETWRGKFTLVKSVPQDAEERDATPLGLFLDTWAWSKE
jgi:type IV secretory pathway TrbF-like protein